MTWIFPTCLRSWRHRGWRTWGRGCIQCWQSFISKSLLGELHTSDIWRLFIPGGGGIWSLLGFFVFVFVFPPGKLDLALRKYHMCNWLVFFHMERDWKIQRIEGERPGFYDFFHWTELVNLILGANIKHCLSYMAVRDIDLLAITT